MSRLRCPLCNRFVGPVRSYAYEGKWLNEYADDLRNRDDALLAIHFASGACGRPWVKERAQCPWCHYTNHTFTGLVKHLVDAGVMDPSTRELHYVDGIMRRYI